MKRNKKEIANKEYNRLITIYTENGADEAKLKINDELIRKVAELFALLEEIKGLPSLAYSRKNPAQILETGAGKARVKYMAQYVNAMTKLNRDLFGAGTGSLDSGLDEFDD